MNKNSAQVEDIIDDPAVKFIYQPMSITDRCFELMKFCKLSMIPNDVIVQILTFVKQNISLWWYYNVKYSQTGGLFLTLEDAIHYVKTIDGYYVKDSSDIIEKEDFYSDHYYVKLNKIPLVGNIFNLSTENPLYILRYPATVYINKSEAYREGVLRVIKKCGSFRRASCPKYPQRNQIVIKCNDAWVSSFYKEELGDIDWVKLFRVRVEEDAFSTKNHIEWLDDEFRYKTLL